MRNSQFKWLIRKASQLLEEKVEEERLAEEDVELVYELFIEPRLRKISDSFSDSEEYSEFVNRVRIKLQEIAKELNREKWDD